MTTTFKTVAGPGTAAFKRQGSRFIGHVHPVESVSKAEATIDRIRSEYDDATHNVPAYRVRDGSFLREYASDAGEPTGSAGDPMATVLAGRELENVLAVVTRYYGGTNLGIGGLVSAYSDATIQAIEDAGVITQQPHTTLQVEVTYADSGTVRQILDSEELEFEATYDETVSLRVHVPDPDRESLVERLNSATSGRVQID